MASNSTRFIFFLVFLKAKKKMPITTFFKTLPENIKEIRKDYVERTHKDFLSVQTQIRNGANSNTIAYVIFITFCAIVVVSVLEGVKSGKEIKHFLLALFTISLLGSMYSAFVDHATAAPEDDKFFGIRVMLYVALGLLAANLVTAHPAIDRLLKIRATKVAAGKGPGREIIKALGILLVIGGGSIVFGFLDNFGMKLGTDALEDGLFWNIGKNAVGGDNESNLANLERFKEFMEGKENLKKLFLDQNSALGSEIVNDIAFRYDTIKDAGSMLGNTFSDFVGALLGAGISAVFANLTGISGDFENPTWIVSILQNPVSKVVLEAVFIGLGCLFPISLHFDAQAKDYKTKFGKDLKINSWFPKLSNSKFKILLIALVVGLILSQMFVHEESDIPASDIPSKAGPLSFICACVAFIIMIFVTWNLYSYVSDKRVRIGEKRAELKRPPEAKEEANRQEARRGGRLPVSNRLPAPNTVDEQMPRYDNDLAA
jgi:hypothetical protein